MENSKYGKYIVTNLKTPPRLTPEYEASYAKWAKRILWMDDDVVNGAFQMNCSWYLKPPIEKTNESTAHVHDCDEIIGFFGSDPEKPSNLGAEIEFWIEDEMHIITNSALIFMPKGMKHNPLKLRRVDRPIFHFTVMKGSHYTTTKIP
jgi:hypothetical protein